MKMQGNSPTNFLRKSSMIWHLSRNTQNFAHVLIFLVILFNKVQTLLVFFVCVCGILQIFNFIVVFSEISCAKSWENAWYVRYRSSRPGNNLHFESKKFWWICNNVPLLHYALKYFAKTIRKVDLVTKVKRPGYIHQLLKFLNLQDDFD